jgi:asparagine synthetase B (glutamine-hydrolysing)
MSGIFGLFDRAGVDPTQVASIARGAAGYRGNTLATRHGDVVIGVFHRGESPALAGHDTAVTVVDGRIYGTVDGGRVHATAVAFLDDLLASKGPDALATIAADFVLARYDARARILTLARDAFGIRPLFWATARQAFGFASDPQILINLGLADGELDDAAVSAFLARRELIDGRTAFRGIRTLLPGHRMTVDPAGRLTQHRWFRPEEFQPVEMTLDEAIERVRTTVGDSTASRVEGRKAVLALSGGHDSAAIAVASARRGFSITCVTQTFDPVLGVSEDDRAAMLARAEGHELIRVPVSSAPSARDLGRLPAENGGPLGHPAFPLSLSIADAASATEADVLLTGEGGDSLFGSPSIAILDLLRNGDVRRAFWASRAYRHTRHDPYLTQAKALFRGTVPPALLRAREYIRPVAPWVPRPVPRDLDPLTAPRSAVDHLHLALQRFGGSTFDVYERMLQLRQMEISHPLLDMRVVRLALSLPIPLRLPDPVPKPTLTLAFLERWSATRIKNEFFSYYIGLARYLRSTFTWLATSDSLAVLSGYAIAERIHKANEDRWALEFLSLVPVQMWLRDRLEGKAAR